MKKILLATTCLALSSAAAMAADMTMPMQTKAPAYAPAFSWTGCYVGAHVGGGTLTSPASNSEGAANANGSGAIAGGQVGCNYQDGNWVFGLEGEGYWSGIKATQNSSFIPTVLNPGGQAEAFGTTTKNSNDFTIAARTGIAFDRTLIYGKGGWAWGNYKVTSFDTGFGAPPIPSSSSQSGYLDGFMVGVGIEHALTRNWTVKLEYDYIGFGSKELAFNQCSGNVCAQTGTSSVSSTKQLFKVGANYLFDLGGR
jgi:outer membrane immunogenic protein